MCFWPQPIYHVGRIADGEGVRSLEGGVVGVAEVHDHGVLVVVRRLFQDKIGVFALDHVPAECLDAVHREFRFGIGVQDDAPVRVDKVVVSI